MAKWPNIFFIFVFISFFTPVFSEDNPDVIKCETKLNIENTALNPRLVNLAPEQFKALEIMEKRLYKTIYDNDNNIDRIERLELEYFNEIRNGTATQRINALKIASGRAAIRGTAMTPMMMESFNSRFINQHPEIYHDDVGIIDGLVRLWWPDFYSKVTEYRKYKEENFYQYN